MPINDEIVSWAIELLEDGDYEKYGYWYDVAVRVLLELAKQQYHVS